MKTSNSLFFAVSAIPPREAAGWEVRVLDHRDCTTVLAVVYQYMQLTIGPELIAPGSESTPGNGSVTLDADSPFWATTLSNGRPATDLLEYEHLWEAHEDGELRFQWFGTTIQESIVEEDSARTITISGPGSAQVLKWACVIPIGEPAPSAEREPNYTDEYNWKFPVSYSAMRMWVILLRAAQARGTIPWVDPMFTEMNDPAGKPWSIVFETPETIAEPENGIKPEPGMNLFDLLNRHTGQDPDAWFAESLEWVMRPGFKLDVRRTIGTDVSSRVIFFEGAIEQLERSRSREDIANYVVTIDVYGEKSPAVDTASIAKWGQRERLQNNNSNITDQARRDQISQVFLQQSKDEQVEWTIKVPYDEPGRRPFIDYNLGDWIGVSRLDSNLVSTVDKYRVMAIVINVEDGATTVELTLQSKLKLRQLQLQRQITAIIHQVNNTTTTMPASATPAVDPSNIPGDPVIPTYDPATGKWSNINLNGGRLGGTKVFMQDEDPGSEAQPGDFWIDTNGQPKPDPPAVSPPDPHTVDTIYPDGFYHSPTGQKFI